ncbi:uncharacterized protein LOC111805835 isoform X1 [Cucurbita pepo subsp. pepo]|uniref:uncharacterized protein LOC111805545 n=2 Tax=Cucurbita pepo subsp. pepo TaxID=3664 RepID=UPI000C9D7F5E|nr:uncharacterized protein LOC111805545 [Cucurbita pepo subsp. pepo]XP_023546844.1 uncharacterized protein LOC111805835 isoform X1 [Cucurbita pepo subsp. pepo]
MESPNPNPQPPVSGASIRSLVKHLKTKESINPSKMAEQIPKPHKKQVRRRLHTSRPYQERLLNMAEARREIVTALKYHRAAMKKAEQELQPQTPLDPSPARSHEAKIRPRKILKSSSIDRNRVYDSQTNFNTNSNNYYNLKNLSNYDPSMNCSFPIWSLNSQSMEGDNMMSIVLPEQTLGLNLNLQDFNNLEMNLFSNGNSVSVSGSGSGSGSSSSSSPSLSIETDQEAPNWTSESNTSGGGSGGGLHVAVGEEEMAEIRSIGDKHEMEWSDKMNLVKSAWWLRFMKIGKKEEEGIGFGFGDEFDQILEFPDWMNNGNETCFQEQLLNDYCSNDHDDHPSSALPCMDIGEFEGMDGEWLA